jgi:competence protein ComEC
MPLSRTPALVLLLAMIAGMVPAQIGAAGAATATQCLVPGALFLILLLMAGLRHSRAIPLAALSAASCLAALAAVIPREALPLACEEKVVIVARTLATSPAFPGGRGARVRARIAAAFNSRGEEIPSCEGKETLLTLDTAFEPPPGEIFAAGATFLGWRTYQNDLLTGQSSFATAPLKFKGYVRDFSRLGTHPEWSLERLRSSLARHFVRHLSGRTAAFLGAILLGERTSLGPDDQEVLRRSGAYHVLSISGTHISLLAVVFMTLLSGCGIPRRAAAWLAIVLLLGYVILAGGSPPAVRSFIMVAVYSGAFLLQRYTSALNALFLAAILILVFVPAELANAGFQLSFTGVAGILIAVSSSGSTQAKEQSLPLRILAWILLGSAVSTAAFLAQVPTMIYFFGTLYPISIVANFAIIPLVGLILPLGIAFLCASLAWEALASFLSPVMEFAVQALFFAAGTFARAPVLEVGPGELVILTTVSLGALLLLSRIPAGSSAMTLLTASCITALVLGLPAAAACPPGSVRIAFLDVGEGDSSVIELGGRRIVIDTGTTGAIGRRSQITEYLRARGARSVDLFILSHPHDDHFGDALEILRRYDVRMVVGTEPRWKSTRYAELLETLREKQIPYWTSEWGDTLRMEGACFTFFDPRAVQGSCPSQNDYSLAVRFEASGLSIFFPGDAEACTERKLMRLPAGVLESHVLKLAHHGSKTSTGPDFLGRVDPRIAVISCERAGRFGHPAREVLDRLEKRGTAAYRTDVHGGLLLLWEEGHLEVRTSLPEE